MAKHTPLPWRTTRKYNAYGKPGKLRIEGGETMFAGSTTPEFRTVAVIDERGWHGGFPHAEEDAEFIVRAVNSHAGLVEALRFMVDAAETEPGMSIYKAHVDKARAALTKAGY